VKAGDVIATSVLSGNRNFEGRVHPEVKMNFLASPPLVVAYALAGTDIDLTTEPLGTASDGKPVMSRRYLAAARKEVADTVARGDRLEHVPQQLRRRVCGRCELAGDRSSGRQALHVGREIDLRTQPAVLRRHDDKAGAVKPRITIR
jgi:hypothetical protein